MYKTLLGLHSGFRYIVLILIVLALVLAITGLFGKKNYTEANRKINLFTMISGHIQLLIGLGLYFVSPYVDFSNMKDSTTRYWTAEHLAMMIFAIILLTVGHARAKKAIDSINKHRAIALYYGLAVLVILLAVYQSGRPLFGMSV